MTAQLALFAPPCACVGHHVWPVGRMCDEGERLLQAKNEACYREGALLRGEAEGDAEEAARLVEQAMKALHAHVRGR